MYGGAAMDDQASRPGQRNGSNGRRIPVADSSGARMGWVTSEELRDDPLIVESGLLYPTEVEIPRSWISRMTAECIYLSKTRREVERDGHMRAAYR